MLSVDMALVSAVYALYHFAYCYIECLLAECLDSKHSDIQHTEMNVTLSTKTLDAQC